jgi:cobalt-zinc-cadmium efflux system outer membrane protein
MRLPLIMGLSALAMVPTVGAQTATEQNSPSVESGDLRLGDVIRAALSQGPLVEAARARVTASRAAARAARAFPNPTLTWQTENGPFPGASSPPSAARENSTFATLPLEFLFQRGPQVRRAEQDQRAAEAELASARWLVARDAARAFGRVLSAQAALAAASDLRQGLAELATFNQTRVAEGATPEGELIRVGVERDRTILEEALAETELASAWADLRPFLPGLSPSPPPHLALGAPASFTLPPLASLLEKSQVSQPQILAARARVESARAQADFERRLLVRQVGAVFGTKRVAGENTMVAGLSLSVPLFDRNRGAAERADAEREAAEQELTWTERRISAQVEAARRSAEVMTARLAALAPDLLGRAEESRRVALAAYREGAGSLLQVLDASRAVAEARQTLGRALMAREQGLLDLRAAIGADPLEGLDIDGEVKER